MSATAIDPVIFKEISALMEDSLPIFIETYIENTHKLLNELERAIPAEDSDNIFHNAHQLKGGSGSVGAMQVFHIAKQMEDIIKGDNGAAEMGSLFIELKSAYAAAEAELKAFLNNYGS